MVNIPLITDTEGRVVRTLMDSVAFMKDLPPDFELPHHPSDYDGYSATPPSSPRSLSPPHRGRREALQPPTQPSSRGRREALQPPTQPASPPHRGYRVLQPHTRPAEPAHIPTHHQYSQSPSPPRRDYRKALPSLSPSPSPPRPEHRHWGLQSRSHPAPTRNPPPQPVLHAKSRQMEPIPRVQKRRRDDDRRDHDTRRKYKRMKGDTMQYVFTFILCATSYD